MGFIVSFFLVNRGGMKGWPDMALWFAATMLVAIPFGLAAWGLLP